MDIYIYIYIVSRESYQSTSIMRWDRGIFGGPSVAVSRDENFCSGGIHRQKIWSLSSATTVLAAPGVPGKTGWWFQTCLCSSNQLRTTT